ncbi:membrane protein AbrB duplication [Desulfitobacterium dichloroeliminans LMG P-21439]|uniref:Membrane protein AbrB duplication n=1 Tax=Desulfitobacterium dichloroeliminans (strain LMG P-21439 / DCA1) TaxID=871963 RepID=L0F543_DESDL|nr:AbrB family transcriptional regulator [Desulfitobacterium dichloroeliminans]AGA68312.1 membrane protein AbrB duplication [Desulfitobacterium dichloroeliminans LMG P-21439]
MFPLLSASITISLAVAGYWLLKKINFPAPSIMGPMMFIGIYQALGGGLPDLSMTTVNIFQLIIGLSLGARINHQRLADLRRVLRPSLVIAVWTLLSTLGMTFLLLQFTPNIATALFSAAPGGISEMTVVALAYDTEVPMVSTYQFVRLVVIISVVPIIARWLKRRTPTAQRVAMKEEQNQTLVTGDAEPIEQVEIGLGTKLLLYSLGIMGGLLLLVLGFPGGGVIGAMTTLALTNIVLKKQYQFPSSVLQLALLGIGMSIGLEFSPEVVRTIQEMLLPIIGFSLLIVLSNFVVGWYLHHLTHWDIITCLLSSAPGGLNQMLAVSEEMKADTLTISILQLVRLLIIITCIPIIAVMFI